MRRSVFMDSWAASVLVAMTLVISAIRGLGQPDYGPLPGLARLDAIKFLDPVLLIAVGWVAAVQAVARRTRTIPAWKGRWALCTAFILLTSVISGMYWGAPVYDAAQSILFVLRPACVLLICTAFPWRGRRRWVFWCVLVFAAANLALVISQWLAARATGPDYSADSIIGLFHDAHQQATFSFTLALLSIAYAVEAATLRRRILWVAFIAANAFAGVVSQAQKATGIEAAGLAGGLIVLIFRSRARVARVVKLAPAAALTLVLVLTIVSGSALFTSAAEMATGNLMDRIDSGGYRGMAFLADIGAVRMAEDIWTLSAATPAVLVLGTGPANYGSPAALRRVEQGKANATTRELFWWEAAKEPELVETGELRLLGLSAKTSLAGIVLGEYGLLALLAFVPLLLWPLFIAPRPEDGESGRRRLFWLKAAYLGVVAQSMLNTLGAWDNDVVMTLLFVGFAGVLAVRETSELA